MKAVIYTQYGSHQVLSVDEIQKPTPKPNEVLVKIHAASITTADTMMRRGKPYLGRLMLGLTKPKHTELGTGFAGTVEATGNEVTQFSIGDSVFGESVFGSGTNAEYVCVPVDGVIEKKPENISFEEACSACDGPMTSLNFLRDVAQLQQGQHVLVIGASGSLGSAAVQIAKHMGAIVTAVCSGANAIWVKSLGADRVIDYSREDFHSENIRYDIIFDTVGKDSFCQSKDALTENGQYLSPVFAPKHLLQMLLTSKLSSKKAKFAATGMRPANELRDMLTELKTLFETGKLQSIIDRRYSLPEAANAHAYIEKGHKKGNVVMVL